MDAMKQGTAAIIVSNEKMVHNHQMELISALVEQKAIYGFKSSADVSPESIDKVIEEVNERKIKPLEFPKDNDIFATMLDSNKYK